MYFRYCSSMFIFVFNLFNEMLLEKVIDIRITKHNYGCGNMAMMCFWKLFFYFEPWIRCSMASNHEYYDAMHVALFRYFLFPFYSLWIQQTHTHTHIYIYICYDAVDTLCKINTMMLCWQLSFHLTDIKYILNVTMYICIQKMCLWVVHMHRKHSFSLAWSRALWHHVPNLHKNCHV